MAVTQNEDASLDLEVRRADVEERLSELLAQRSRAAPEAAAGDEGVLAELAATSTARSRPPNLSSARSMKCQASLSEGSARLANRPRPNIGLRSWRGSEKATPSALDWPARATRSCARRRSRSQSWCPRGTGGVLLVANCRSRRARRASTVAAR